MDVFPNVSIILCNGYVSPVGNSEAERTFPLLRRIKSYLGNRMSVDILTGLAMMHIHHDVVIDFKTEMFLKKN